MLCEKAFFADVKAQYPSLEDVVNIQRCIDPGPVQMLSQPSQAKGSVEQLCICRGKQNTEVLPQDLAMTCPECKITGLLLGN